MRRDCAKRIQPHAAFSDADSAYKMSFWSTLETGLQQASQGVADLWEEVASIVAPEPADTAEAAEAERAAAEAAGGEEGTGQGFGARDVRNMRCV